MNKEIWKYIVGYEGFYEVSSFGRVRSLPRLVYSCSLDGMRILSGRLKKQRRIKTEKSIHKGVYVRMAVDLSDGIGGSKTFFVNKLVATAFIPNPKNKPSVMYKDFDTTNNFVDNLRWGTIGEILQYASKNGKYTVSGKNHGNSKKVKQFYRNGKYKRTFHCISEASQITGIGRGSIHDVLAGRGGHKAAGGFIWEYC